MKQLNLIQLAYQRGYQARLELRSFHINPWQYHNGTNVAKYWRLGWRHADMECLEKAKE